MNRDDIIDWVAQVDMAFLKRIEPWNMFDKYEIFADLIRADEREQCAKVADRYIGADPIADAIRNRGNT